MKKNVSKNLGEYAKKGGPGRPKCGRSLAIEILDKMLAEAGNQKILKQAMQEEFKNKPLDFVYKFAYPLMPREIDLGSGGEPIKNVVLGITFKDDK